MATKRRQNKNRNPILEESEPSTSKNTRQRRKKVSVQACDSCRKHKTRCEILDDISTLIQCHRCKVLKVECSYQSMDRAIFEATIMANKDSGDPKSPANESGEPTPGSSNSSRPTSRVIETFPNHLWRFLCLPPGSLDWSAPLDAIQELTKQTLNNSQLPSQTPPNAQRVPNDSLENILSSDQIQYLTTLFELNYLPWLNISLTRDKEKSPLLDLVCCTIASRHFDDAIRSSVAPRLQSLTTEAITKMILQSRRRDSELESIQCLLILSLWAPVCGGDESLDLDGRLLIASAVSMAFNMHLNNACEQLQLLKAKGVVDGANLQDVMDRTRLWIALTNVESLLCTGNGRTPLSKRTSTYLKVFHLTSELPGSDLATCRDVRLRLLGELFESTETGMTITLQSLSASDLEAWHSRFLVVLGHIDHIIRLLLPLPVITEFDPFYFKTLLVVAYTCKSLVLYHAFVSARRYFSLLDNGPHPHWFKKVRPRGMFVLSDWGKEVVVAAECALVNFLEADFHLLATTPDYIFNMISFSSSFLVAVKFFITHIGVNHPGTLEKLLEKTIEKLNQCSLSSDSAARKCSVLVAGMLALWENRTSILEEYYRDQNKKVVPGDWETSISPPPYSPTFDIRRFTTPSTSDGTSSSHEPYRSEALDLDESAHDPTFLPSFFNGTDWSDLFGEPQLSLWNDVSLHVDAMISTIDSA